MPILVDGDVLLHGRNRLKVCLELGMQPKVQQFDHSVSAIQAIYDLNINRRTLTDDQIVVISAQLMAMKYAEQAKQAQKAGVSADGAAGGRGRIQRKVLEHQRRHRKSRRMPACLTTKRGRRSSCNSTRRSWPKK